MKKKLSLKQILAGAGALVILILVGWFAWPIQNPVLGKWEALPLEGDSFPVQASAIGKIEFRESSTIQDGQEYATSYEVLDRNTVIVKTQTAFGGVAEEKYTVKWGKLQRPVSFLGNGIVEYKKI